LVAAAILLAAMPIASWLAEIPVTAPPGAAAHTEMLPIVRASDMHLARARALAASGHVADALRALDRIDIADPALPEADALRSELQQQLLATVGGDREDNTGRTAPGRVAR
jgi:hypothetical protein